LTGLTGLTGFSPIHIEKKRRLGINGIFSKPVKPVKTHQKRR
jgi:hypothetical protein